MSDIISPAQVAEIRARAEGVACHRCRGSRRISVKHGQTFETDSADEIADAYHVEDCPACASDVPALCDSYDAQARRIDELEADCTADCRRCLTGEGEHNRTDEWIARQDQAAEIQRLKADAKAQGETLHRIIRQICESIGCESPDEHGNGCAPLLAALVEIERLKADASTVAHREDVRDRVDELAYATAKDRIIALSDEVGRLKAKMDGIRRILDSASAHSPGCICEPCCKLALIQGAAK